MTDADARWRDLLTPALLPRAVLIELGIWLNAADGLVTITLMPSVARDLGGVAYFGWAVAAFLTASVIAGASAGQVSRVLGLRGATLIAALAYTVGCVASATSSDIFTFLAGRAAQGLGSGWIIGFCYVAIEAVFPQRLWARLFAAAAGAWGVASLVGPLIGGAFADGGRWRWAFWMFAGQCGIFAVASTWLLTGSRADPATRSPLAWRTLATLALSVILIAVANVTRGVSVSFAFLAAGLAVFILALWVNARPGEGLLPKAAGRPLTTAGAGYAMIFILEVGTVGLNVYQAAILQAAYGVSALTAGYVVSTTAMGWTAAAFLVSAAPEHRRRRLIVSGASLILVGYSLLAAVIARASLGWVAVAGVTIGAGFGLAWSLVNQRIISNLPEADRANGASTLPTTQLIGGAVGAAASGALANLLGLSRDFGLARAKLASPILFAAFIPIVGLGVVAAIRVTRPASGDAR